MRRNTKFSRVVTATTTAMTNTENAAAGPSESSVMRGSMPLYHFDLVNWKAVVDAGGADLADDIEAMNSADVIARRLLERLPQLKNRHYAVLVTNEEGDEVCRLPLDVVH